MGPLVFKQQKMVLYINIYNFVGLEITIPPRTTQKTYFFENFQILAYFQVKGAETNLYTFRYLLVSESIQICFRTLYFIIMTTLPFFP